MRLRALLHVTAMCLLLEAATVSAEAQKPAAPLAPLKTESTLKPLEIDPLGRTESTRKAWEPKVRLSKTASTLKAPKQPLAKEFDPRLQVVQKIDSRFSYFSVVPGTVKRFAKDFEAGAKNPKSYLPQVSPELLSKWNAVPREKRIFIIGAGKDSAEVSEAAKALQAQGNAVFFYDFCRPLCSSEAVGAMFGTSGDTMLYHTSSADLSKYVQVEVATARFLDGLDKPVILIPTEELLAAKTFQMRVAEMRMPTPSPVK